MKQEETTREILGGAMEVLNTLGHGLAEKLYENALVVEFRPRGVACSQQQRYTVRYKGEVVGDYVPDLVVNDNVIVDTKTVERITGMNRADAELPSHNRVARRARHQFQTCYAAMETCGTVNGFEE